MLIAAKGQVALDSASAHRAALPRGRGGPRRLRPALLDLQRDCRATRGREIIGHRDPAIFDTLALAAYRNGLVEDAIRIQTVAIQRARAAGFDRSEIAEKEERFRIFRR